MGADESDAVPEAKKTTRKSARQAATSGVLERRAMTRAAETAGPDSQTGTERTTARETGIEQPDNTPSTAPVVTADRVSPTSAPATIVDTGEPVLGAGAATTATELASAATGQPLVETSPEQPPLQAAVAVAALAAVRDELERNAMRRNASPNAVAAASPESKNVLLIGVDGTNLSKVLSDPANANFFTLIQESTTAPSSIVGHTTISNPSWTSILTGFWGERTGVINNIFTPWTYDNYPTVFNQLEGAHGDGIQTTAIANWDVIAAIAAAGANRADTVHYIGPESSWAASDDLVGSVTGATIAAADRDVANFIFSYFVGVDEAGHAYGGGSQEYTDALLNFDRNLGLIMQQVRDWEAANGEEWTVILVTDHGHQPQRGLGHGFQSPDETGTFVVVRGEGFGGSGPGNGLINLQYEIVDVTPTVVTLFGGTVRPGSDGTSMTELTNNVRPIDNDDALRAALQDIIGKNGYPDIATDVALGVRTIFASIPYFLVDIVDGIVGGLKAVAGQNIFLVSFLAGAAVGPVEFIGDLGYVVTNFAAQIVARITGVTGASIFPLWPPAAPDFTPYDPDQLITMVAVCGDPSAAGTASCPVSVAV
ncbi:MAG: alkaline phosphatase family protein [Mycolicibacterium neoaurum]|uniref:alkaline phosphatase family protein n=1 Tax=Mycolicibacterium neoaurum TaxID=1795 RepID=UPI003A5AC42D